MRLNVLGGETLVLSGRHLLKCLVHLNAEQPYNHVFKSHLFKKVTNSLKRGVGVKSLMCQINECYVHIF